MAIASIVKVVTTFFSVTKGKTQFVFAPERPVWYFFLAYNIDILHPLVGSRRESEEAAGAKTLSTYYTAPPMLRTNLTPYGARATSIYRNMYYMTVNIYIYILTRTLHVWFEYHDELIRRQIKPSTHITPSRLRSYQGVQP